MEIIMEDTFKQYFFKTNKLIYLFMYMYVCMYLLNSFFKLK